MCEKVETIKLIDRGGRLVEARRITFYESKDWMDAGGVATSYITELPDGTRLHSLMGDQAMLDTSTGNVYTRAI